MSQTSSLIPEIWSQFLDEKVHHRKWMVAAYVQYVKNLTINNFPPILEFNHLSNLIGIERDLLAKMITNPAHFYRKFEIPKRLGGMRTIQTPSPTLLHIQRWIKKQILDNINVHDSSFAYVKGRSFIDNARSHLGQNVVVRFDLKDFFPSISIKNGLSIFNRCGYSRKVSYYLASLCFVDGILPQGSATSPSISNIIAKRLDRRLFGLATKLDLTFTRYADDIIFSGSSIPDWFVGSVSNIISEENFTINSRKTRIMSGNNKKIVTGISVSGSQLKLPRPYSREIRFKVHMFLKKGLSNYTDRPNVYDPLALERLIGKLIFWLQVEPDNEFARIHLELMAKYKAKIDSM